MISSSLDSRLRGNDEEFDYPGIFCFQLANYSKIFAFGQRDSYNVVMEIPIDSYFFVIPLILAYITGVFVVSYFRKNSGTLDIAWGIGFVTIAWFLYFINGTHSNTQLLINILVTLWGVRLFLNILVRSLGKPEDSRYTEMRKGWKYPWLTSYFFVFLPQALFMLIIASPIILINSHYLNNISNIVYLGVAIWVVGFIFETCGDLQLMLFLKQPENKGKILASGLWSLTRHPNYFGEITQWWGIYVIIIAAFGLSGLWTIISPVAITWLLLKVSGIPLLEKRYAGNKEFDAYKQRTNALIPWFRKNRH